jgi:hypothetical protein
MRIPGCFLTLSNEKSRMDANASATQMMKYSIMRIPDPGRSRGWLEGGTCA